MDYINTYKVYVKTNADGIITSVNSSAFLFDTTNWTEIDEGTSDRYHHAQGNYLECGLTDEQGIYNYMLIDGKAVERSEEHKQPEVNRINAIVEIVQLKQKLADTDYIAAKLAEGVATKEEYAEQLIQRAEWRMRINELEKLI